MAKDPNRFTAKTRRLLGQRAGYICSNPYCRQLTIGPHTVRDKIVDVGEAAHIFGANPGSARYESEMTPKERSDIENGIWLCRRCAKLIDSDAYQYNADLLLSWKEKHEEKIANHVRSSVSALDEVDEDEPYILARHFVLPSDNNEPFTFELEENDLVYVAVSSDIPVDVLLISDEDYENWYEEGTLLPEYIDGGETVYDIDFTHVIIEGGEYIVLVANQSDKEADINIFIEIISCE